MVETPGKPPHGVTRHFRTMYLTGIAAAGIFGSTLLMAHLIVSGNAEEVSSTFVLLLFFLAISLFFTVTLLVLFALLPFRLAKLIAVAIAAYALVSLALDAALPLGIGALEEGTESAPPAPHWGTLVQVLGTAALAYLIWRMPLVLAGSLGWTMVLVIIVTTVVPLTIQAVFHERKQPDLTPRKDAPPFNIYHVVLDSYYGPWLPWAINTLGIDPGIFSEFVHYPNARSNYWSTMHSYMSFMSGSMFDARPNLFDWEAEARKNSVLNDIKDAGFVTHFYGPNLRQTFRSSDWTHLKRDMKYKGVPTDINTILDLWLARSAPVGLRHRLFQDGEGLATWGLVKIGFKPGYSGRSSQSLRQFRIMLEDEKERPPTGSYTHIFVEPPHPPWELDRNGNYVVESSYVEELLLATRLMRDLVQRLKDLGRYDSSVIILHSDHAQYIIGNDHFDDPTGRDFTTIDSATSELIRLNNPRGVNGRETDARYRPLLLVKPPASCFEEEHNGPVVDKSLVELKHIRNFILDVIKSKDQACAFPARDYVDMHIGARAHVDEDGKRMWVGQQLKEGKIQVYRVHDDGRWEIRPSIEFEYQ